MNTYEIDLAMRNIIANQHFEGLEVTPTEADTCRRILAGTMDAGAAIATVLAELPPLED